MPLSEFYGLVNKKNESPQLKASDISYIPNDEFVELVWEKGQIMMQGQSSNARKTPVSSNFQFHTSKVQENGTSVEMGLNQDDDMVPWLNYPLDDYCSDLLPEISGVTVNEPSPHNGFSLIENKDGCNQIGKDSHSHNASIHHGVSLDQSNTSKASSSKASNLFPWSLDRVQIPTQSLRPGVSHIGSNNTRSNPHSIINGNSIQGQGLLGGLDQMVQKQDSILPCASSGLLNFSHFSRPAAIARANLQSNGLPADSGSSGLDIMKNNEQHAALNSVNRESQKEMGLLSQPSSALAKVVLNALASKPLDDSHCVKKSDPVHREDATENDKSPNVALDASAPKGDPDTEKSVEPIGASSSVCSGNNAERASNGLTKKLKRKARETEDFECQSEDAEEESLGAKTAATSRGGTGSKRSRAAAVHNLSERRRRDRINEKMRALQELIPNCNKVDKASMLDEAIEYLKTLQLQVQIMSMGTGFCMPPTMFSTGMQHMYPTHVPQLSHMGNGMGMGYGPYGMGMVDINGGSQGHPHMISLPPTQGARYPFPSPPISGLNIFQGIPGSNLQVYGHPGQGMPMLFPQPPMVRIPVNSAVRQMGTHMEFPNLAPILKDPMQNRNPHMMTQTSSQFQVANEGLDQSTLVGKNDQVPEVRCSTVISPLNSNSKPTGCD